MDERDWWIATKIQETFRVNDIDRYVVVCSFICFTPLFMNLILRYQVVKFYQETFYVNNVLHIAANFVSGMNE